MKSCVARLVAMIAMSVTAAAYAQSDFPTRPIRLVVPFAAGGSSDVIARLFAERYSEPLGRAVIVENRPGAGSVVGSDVVAKAPADGYTLLLSANSAIAPGPLMRDTMPYDAIRDFVHIALIGSFVNAVVVRADSPYRTLREFIDAAKANPGKLTYASAGVGSSGFLSGELLKRRAGIDITHVPYKGAGPASIDLIGGRIDAQFESLVTSTPNVRAGKTRLLAVASQRRVKAFPDVPTASEVIPNVSGAPWFGISAPAKTPGPVLDRLERDAVRVLRNPDFRNLLEERGMEPSGANRAEFLQHIHAENKLWEPIIKALNVKVE
jgi:tripartite-type tricarboxylate transporter receptor subunit TctC